MNKARSNPLNAVMMHGVLIFYTLIALFPVFIIIINSFKERRSIFREPLALPNADSFSTIGYETVMKQGDFSENFDEEDDSLVFKTDYELSRLSDDALRSWCVTFLLGIQDYKI